MINEEEIKFNDSTLKNHFDFCDIERVITEIIYGSEGNFDNISCQIERVGKRAGFLKIIIPYSKNQQTRYFSPSLTNQLLKESNAMDDFNKKDLKSCSTKITEYLTTEATKYYNDLKTAKVIFDKSITFNNDYDNSQNEVKKHGLGKKFCLYSLILLDRCKEYLNMISCSKKQDDRWPKGLNCCERTLGFHKNEPSCPEELCKDIRGFLKPSNKPEKTMENMGYELTNANSMVTTYTPRSNHKTKSLYKIL